MPKPLKPFRLGGSLDYCPECGATGDYSLLAAKALKVQELWEAAGRWPDTGAERAELDAAIVDMTNCIGMQR